MFLKIVYHGPRAMEELVAYDPHLVVGILGGGAGTTYDAFKLIAEAQKYGARAALFGRKINNAECQLAFVEFLRRIVDREITPEEAVRAYHAVLEKLEDQAASLAGRRLQLQTGVMSYGGLDRARAGRRAWQAESVAAGTGMAMRSTIAAAAVPPAKHECHCHDKPAPANAAADGKPDFAAMSRAEKLAYNQAKRDRIFG